jgi:hypothetical protein
MSEHPADQDPIAHSEHTDALGWALIAAGGLALSALAVHLDARLGTASAPFLGRYEVRIGPGSVLAPTVAAVVIFLAARGKFTRSGWPAIQFFAYVAALAWTLALALVDGLSGLTEALGSPEEYLGDVQQVGDSPFAYISTFTAQATNHSFAARGHPPGPVLLLWLLDRAGVTDHVTLGFLITALATLTVPLVLSTVKDSCGESAARAFLPVVVLAPYAVWIAVSMDAVIALLGAAAAVACLRASRRQVRGWQSLFGALLAGALIGVAALFSYAAPWLGLSVVCVYFARRRPFLIVATGVGALLPVLGARLLGFGWAEGLLVAEADYSTRIEPYRSVLWWSAISVVALFLAAGPPLVASARKVRNTPAWPFVVGAGAAVLFTIVAGLARGGVEHAWLPFFPWLTVAAVAPEHQAGPPVPSPILLVALGAAVAIAVQATVATPW